MAGEKRMEFSEWLRLARDERGYTLMSLADRAEVSHVMIALVEQGKRNPSREMVTKLAEALNKDVDSALFAAGYVPDSALAVVTNQEEADLVFALRGATESERRMIAAVVRETRSRYGN